MVGFLAHCFKGLQGSSTNVGEPKHVYRDDLNEKSLHKTDDSVQQSSNKPLQEKEGLKPICRNNNNIDTTKKKTNKVVRFADEHTAIKPRNSVVRFHVETLNDHNREGLVAEEKKEEVIIRVKIKMTKTEAERLLSRPNQNDGVLELRRVADHIGNAPFHRVHVATVVVPRNKDDKREEEKTVVNYNKYIPKKFNNTF